jgi:Golgi nucleoside diphosphatase
MAIEIVDLPSYKMVDLSIVMCKFTRAYLPRFSLAKACDMMENMP